MVVGDDHVYADVQSVLNRRHVFGAAVDGEQQCGAGGGRVVGRLRRESVPVAKAVGQAPADIGTKLAQDVGEQEGGADAVGVVVAVDHDALATR